jgi:hypothetical protein
LKRHWASPANQELAISINSARHHSLGFESWYGHNHPESLGLGGWLKEQHAEHRAGAFRLIAGGGLSVLVVPDGDVN